MPGKKSVEERLGALERGTMSVADSLYDTKGVLAELDVELGKTIGLVAKLDASFFSASNVARQFIKLSTNLFGDLAEQVINYDEGIRRATAGNEKMLSTLKSDRDAIFDLSKATAKFGVSSRENLETGRLLAQQNVKMLPIYRDNKISLIDFTARMSAFGVTTETSTGLLATLTSHLDMTGDQLDSTRRQLVAFSKATGQEISAVMQSYSKSIGKFMDFLNPDEMNKNFMQFQTMARRMGTEADGLYEMALKFDTLEGAQAVGAKLNQTFSNLGIEFNSIALQEMEPKERIDYISTKTREALSKAKQMGGREGRLIMASLRDSGLYSSNEMIRAMEAEGGLRRAGDYDLGATIPPMDRDAEAAFARRQNFTKVERAEAEERAAQAMRLTKSYQLFESSVSDFGGSILEMADILAPLKDSIVRVKAQELDKVIFPSIALMDNFLKGGSLSPETQQFLDQQGLKNIKNIKDLVAALNSLSAENLDTVVKSGIGGMIGNSIIKGVQDGVKEAQKILKMATD